MVMNSGSRSSRPNPASNCRGRAGTRASGASVSGSAKAVSASPAAPASASTPKIQRHPATAMMPLPASGASREHESVRLTTLGGMLDEEINMQTTVIVGNSQTFAWQGRMVTPRGYSGKYGLDNA